MEEKKIGLRSALDAYASDSQRAQMVGSELKRLGVIGKGLCVFLARFGTLPVVVMLRSKFGERYLTPGQAIVAAVLLAFIGPIAITNAIAQNLSGAQAGISLVAGFAFSGAFLIVVTIHLIFIRLRARRGERWHSYCDGLPLPIWRWLGGQWGFWTPSRLFLLGEPGVCAVLGLIAIVLQAPGLGLYLWGQTVLLLGSELTRRSRERSQLLDLIDSQIEAEQQSTMLRGAPASETEGYVVRGMQPRTAAERRTIEEMITSLEPRVREMLGNAAMEAKFAEIVRANAVI